MRIDTNALTAHALHVPLEAKTSQLQIRVTPRQKAELGRRARAAGMDVSSWVLGRLLPQTRPRFISLVAALAREPMSAFVLAELHDLLESLVSADFEDAVEALPRAQLDAVSANQLAAMVETRAARLKVFPPRWTDDIEPLREPWFPTTLRALQLHLLCNSPPAFRRRNLFVDATLGDRR